jgi:hypothetical protein
MTAGSFRFHRSVKVLPDFRQDFVKRGISNGPSPTPSAIIKSCGALIIYGLFAVPFLEELFSGSFIGAFGTLFIAHLTAQWCFRDDAAVSMLKEGPMNRRNIPH